MFLRAATVLTLLALGGAQATLIEGEQPAAPIPAQSEARSPRNASYRISARLDPTTRTITGDEVITWRNTANTPATSLRFHLYYNAWRNTQSSWMRERILGGNTALAKRPADDWGWIDLTSMRLTRGGTTTDVLPRLQFIAPDDGNAEDRTVVETPLDAAVMPGESVEIRIAWTSRVPRTFARTGTIGNFFFIAQWFPKIGVL